MSAHNQIVEGCILTASSVDKRCVVCKHGDLPLAQVAPDVVFLDLGEELVINNKDIIREKLLGHGAFGFFFQRGISCLSLPSGTKGFAGTKGFMASEIINYNSEEEYTEQVACFSYGIFIYKLIKMHQLFEIHESAKESILEEHRPALTYRETAYPSYLIDLMAVC
ncbi:Protein kinase domain,Protein kinase-like domain [Cinara cedri]|uniref:Protein kinase domain,Protein kinase-like domain n=1 Tax=Cinara cedri TaxID=506608 RepID=A0A5E4NSB9_9HEMI|nr:Protein kinase domain,Protein kinase-like domain [Cinara cedri]